MPTGKLNLNLTVTRKERRMPKGKLNLNLTVAEGEYLSGLLGIEHNADRAGRSWKLLASITRKLREILVDGRKPKGAR